MTSAGRAPAIGGLSLAGDEILRRRPVCAVSSQRNRDAGSRSERLRFSAGGARTLATAVLRAYGRVMELLEITRKERLTREEAAQRLHALADSLAKHNDVEFERNGVRFKLHVPDEVELKVELEVEDGGTELELELT